MRSRLPEPSGRDRPAHGWTLIPELAACASAARAIRPDGTLRDDFYLARGYWEAKDTARRPRRRDPQEDRQGLPADQHHLRGHPPRRPRSRTAGQAMRGRPARAASSWPTCSTHFFAYTEPDIEDFEQAVDGVQGARARPGPRAGREDRRRPQEQQALSGRLRRASSTLCRTVAQPEPQRRRRSTRCSSSTC